MYRIGQAEKDAVARVIDSGKLFKINNGLQEVLHAEEEIKAKFGVKHSVLMTSGHGALVAALTGMGVGPGDEVIAPAYTYIATAMAVVAAGAMPVIAEVDDTLTLDAADVEKKITSRTKAILPVHMQGLPTNMDAIMEVAKKHQVMVLEDACQAAGASFKGQYLGTIGDAGAFSFNYYKIISCGEGGALLTNRKDIFECAMIYHDSSAIAYFGNQLDDITIPQFCGAEYRSNEIQAAILREQLKRLDGIMADNRKNKKIMMDELSSRYQFAPCNDPEGELAMTLAVRFETEKEARIFAAADGVNGVLPIDTGKHVYCNWTPIMEKRGAFHPAMDPFKMEANRDIVPNYTADMCPKTLDILAKTVYVNINPDETEAELEKRLNCLKNVSFA